MYFLTLYNNKLRNEIHAEFIKISLEKLLDSYFVSVVNNIEITGKQVHFLVYVICNCYCRY